MNALISVVTKDSSFYKQIVQMIPLDIQREGIEILRPGDSLNNAQIIVTDMITDEILDQGIPVFLFAEKMPEDIVESVSLRFYKKTNFDVKIFQKDLAEWIEIAFALDGAAEKTRDAEAKKEKYKERVAVYKKSLELAKLMQLSAMEPKAIKNFEQRFYYQPAFTVSGDFLIVEEIDNKVFVIIGDVTDHGYNTGLYGASLVGGIRGFLDIAPRYSLNLAGLVNYVYHSWNNYNYQKDPSYATMLFCMIDKENASIEFINYGHESPFLIHENKVSILDVSEEKELAPMGAEKRLILTPKVFPFLPGDALFVDTDGVTEVFKDPEDKDIRKAYSEERILASVQHEVLKPNWTLDQVIRGVRKDADSYSVTEDFENQNLLGNHLDGAVDDVTMYMLRWLK